VYQRKFDELVKDMNGEESRIVGVNENADQLIADGHQSSTIITEKKQQVNEAWAKLKQLAALRSEKLKAAHEIYGFTQEAADTLSWMTEKDQMLSTDDYGKDLVYIQSLQRKHEALERDLAAVEDKVEALCKRCGP